MLFDSCLRVSVNGIRHVYSTRDLKHANCQWQFLGEPFPDLNSIRYYEFKVRTVSSSAVGENGFCRKGPKFRDA